MSKKKAWFSALARPYIRRKLRRTFSDVRFAGLLQLQRLSAQEPVILACNHVAWWDPLLLIHLERFLNCDGYCLMDKQGLAELPFFEWVGALPVDRASSKKAYRDLTNAGQVLYGPGKVLAIFPQGEQRPAHLPLSFKPGVVNLAATTNAAVVPVALRYDYFESPRPIVHFSAGAPLRFDPLTGSRESFLEELETSVEQELRRIDSILLSAEEPTVSLLGRTLAMDKAERLPSAASALKLLSQDGGS